MRNLSIRRVLFVVAVLLMSSAAFGQLRISVTFGPPPIPVYVQPLCPGDGYIWVPGYWAWSDDDDDYFWVPGTWVLAPEVGFLWTPPYWAWVDGAFVFYDGYWGPNVGFYGGINYGFGYFGEGFVGGRWDDGHYFYNRSVTNVNVTNVHNVYNTTVINNNTTINRVSYNGGDGGVQARPTPQDEQAAHERHLGPAAAQVQQMQAARGNRELRASSNHGKPPVAATVKPGEFRGHEVVAAKEAGGAYNPPANRRGGQPGAGNGARGGGAVHVKDLPPLERPSAANTGNPATDRKYQQQMEKMNAKQEQEREKLQRKQEQEDQRMAKNANDARRQETESRHQQQTEQMRQRHEQERQNLQEKQAPRGNSSKPPR